MASINGVSIKNLKEFKGHEGEPLLQGTVYYQNKQVGFWSQDAHGGPDNFNFNERVLMTPFLKYRSTLKGNAKKYCSLGTLVEDVVALTFIERELKTVQKEGYEGIYLAFAVGTGYYCLARYLTKAHITSKLKNSIKKNVTDIYPDYEILQGTVDTPAELDLTIGTLNGLKSEQAIEAQKERARQEERERFILETKKKEDKISNQTRFRYIPESKVILDTQTGRTAECDAFSKSAVMNVLVNLFC